MALLEQALTYLKYGLQVVPAKPDKRPFESWKELTGRLRTVDELKQAFTKYGTSHAIEHIGILCGKVSGGLEVIDVDCKYDITGTLFQDLKKLIDDNLPKLADSFVIAKTKNGGYHLYYRSENIPGNQKLARRPATPSELEKNRNEKTLVLIETRGEGGFIVTPPTVGYQLIQGDFSQIPPISNDQRNILLSICKSFNEEPGTEPITKTSSGYGSKVDAGHVSPFADYNQRGDILELLQSHGWTIVGKQGERIHLKRPGDSETKTSGNFHEGLRKLYIFSSSTNFEPEKPYSPSDVFTLLEGGNDKKQAYKLLLGKGYGTPPPARNQPDKVSTKHIAVEASDANGETTDLAPTGTLSAEDIKAVNMESAYIYYTAANGYNEVVRSLELLERSSTVPIYLIEVERLDQKDTVIQKSRAYEFRLEDIIRRYEASYQPSEGIDPEDEDRLLKEFVSLGLSISDPIERKGYDTLLLTFSRTNNLPITEEALEDARKKVQYDQQREEQRKDFTNLLEKASQLNQSGDLPKALELLKDRSREIASKGKSDTFARLAIPLVESDMAERLKKKPKDLKTGYTIEDEELLIPAGAVTIIAAPTSHGKTSMMVNLALRVAKELVDKSVYILSFEEDADSIVINAMNTFVATELAANNRKTIRSYYQSGGSGQYFKGNKVRDFEAGKAQFFDELITPGRLHIQYVDYDSDTLMEAIRYLYKECNAGAVLIDYMQLLHKGQQGKNKYSSRQLEIQQICLDLKDTAVETGLPLILGAQFNREVVNPARLHYTKIREAADIEQVANLIVGFWNNKFKSLAADDELDFIPNYDRHNKDAIYVEILKNRGGRIGLTGMFSFDGNTGLIENYEPRPVLFTHSEDKIEF